MSFSAHFKVAVLTTFLALGLTRTAHAQATGACCVFDCDPGINICFIDSEATCLGAACLPGRSTGIIESPDSTQAAQP